MGMTAGSVRRTMATCVRSGILVAVLAAVGCGSMPPSHVELPPDEPETPPAASQAPSGVDLRPGEFTVNVSMLDTWNAIGQILIRLDGVTYEGRAQMLGIYSVQYRGERFLILTRALVMQGSAKGMITKVGAVFLNGKANESAAALELLGLLQQRLPAELALIAAGGRGRVSQ